MAMIYNIENLAKKAGVTRRTVRYYVQRGLLPPPEGEKRGSYYTEEHLERLQQIQRLADQGVPLIHMKKMLEGGVDYATVNDDPSHEVGESSATSGRAPVISKATDDLREDSCSDWKRLTITEGIELHFQPAKIRLDKLDKIKHYIRRLTQGGTIDD